MMMYFSRLISPTLLGLFLTTCLTSPVQPAETVSKSNGKIVFYSFFEYVSSDGIYAVNPDGSELQQLINFGIEPTWSHDGSQVAFAWDGSIWTMNADGSSPSRITDPKAGAFSPNWSPDDSKIVFSGSEDSKYIYDLYIVNSDGSQEHQLTDHKLTSNNAQSPVWSPDGNKIAFVLFPQKCCGNEDAEIYTIDADGSDLQQLTNNSEYDLAPSWSPDGSKIVFSSGLQSFDIYIMNTQGDQFKQLTNTKDQEKNPSWSPDGSKIVYDRGNVLFTMNTDGTKQTQLVKPQIAGLDINPDWQSLASTI